MQRRNFLRSTGLTLVASAIVPLASALPPSRELKISRILVHTARGRRLTPVAANAYAAYRGYDNSETILRIQTEQGIEGIASWRGKDEDLRKLIGMDPAALFTWGEGDVVSGRAEEHRELLERLGGVDVALFDLLGKAMKRPVHALLGGKPVRESVAIYDGTLYMEDLLTPDQLKDLPYMTGAVPSNPVEWVVRKGEWILKNRKEGFKTLKIKIGRMKWMGSFDAAMERDITVTNALRKALGPDVRLMVDGNKAYAPRPLAAAEYAAAVKDANIYFMEEMFPEQDVENLMELKKRLRLAGNPVKLAAGESHGGGVPNQVYTRRYAGEKGEEPLVDIEQADMNAHGFLHLRTKAAIQAKLGMTMAPHNFGSKLGFYAQTHLGLVVPNWEFSEIDDSQIPALQADGIVIQDGLASVVGQPGLGVTLKTDLLERPSLDLKA